MRGGTAVARLDGEGLRLLASTGSGHDIVMDSADGGSGPRPAELLLVAQAGCTAMDVVSILRKKRQPFTSYEVRVAGEQREDPPPHVFERIRIVHVVEGPVDPEAVRRAIELSATKYCTVTGNLASGVAEIQHAYLLRTPAGDEQYRLVAVTGPVAGGIASPTSSSTDPPARARMKAASARTTRAATSGAASGRTPNGRGTHRSSAERH
jgi:putative redox protein